MKVKTTALASQNDSLAETLHLSKSNKKAVASTRKLHDTADILFGLKFADNIHYKFKNTG